MAAGPPAGRRHNRRVLFHPDFRSPAPLCRPARAAACSPLAAWLLALLLSLVAVGGAWAQGRAEDSPAPPIEQQIEALRSQLDGVHKQLGADDRHGAQALAIDLRKLRSTASETQDKADALATQLAAEVSRLQQRLAELGPAPERGATEAADIAAQRAALQRARNPLDEQL